MRCNPLGCWALFPEKGLSQAILSVRYFRILRAPHYHSAYSRDWLARLAGELRQCRQAGIPCWCIFDNTASGAAVANALTLQALLSARVSAE